MPLYDNQLLYDAIKELNIIPSKDLEKEYLESKKTGLPLDNLLLKKDLLSDEYMGKIIADLISVPYVDLSHLDIPNDILQIIPEVVAKSQRIIAFKKDVQGVHVAMANPHNIQMRDFLAKKVDSPVVVYFASERDIFDSLKNYSRNVVETFDQIISENLKKLKAVRGERVEPPIIKIVDTILTYAFQNKASDIHIEPQESAMLVRFRIDGMLHDIISFPLDLHNPILTRIKVLSRLPIDEHQSAQDGKFKFKIGFSNNDLDIRVSIVPITKGEKVVMRLLSERTRKLSLAELGFSRAEYEKVRRSYEKPYGMILATGPTGSGKTTTMYAILKLLNDREVNIATIEDPVEYEIEGINQIQVNPKTNLTFASGLRSILRQDPNIILVGEIRDEETAEIAVNAAMTGHLVLSTLHTNDAVTAFLRLLDMDIEPYLVSSTVNLVIAQRLVRKIHIGCRASKEIAKADIIKVFGQEMVVKIFGKTNDEVVRVYYGKGCAVCHFSAFEGRVGLFEVIEMNDEIRNSILSHADARTIQQIAVKNGMKAMAEDGLDKVKQGLTTIDELVRVTTE